MAGETVTEKIIEKSRFITSSAHIDGEEEAKAFISKIAKAHRDATHNCYAYIADSTGNFLRFSDDGEPQGTAGMPMLEVLKAQSLRQVAVVVTRYFGGIKLGAGGLVRAYSGCVSENLAAAKKVMYQPCVKNCYTVEYPLSESAMRYFNDNDCTLINSEYGNAVKHTVAVKSAQEKEFNAALINRLNGRVEIERIEEYLFPFEID